MSFFPKKTKTPPTLGHPKQLWSPDLFDSATGDYPISPLPDPIHYPTDTDGTFWFFDGFTAARIWPTSDSGGGANAWDEQDHTPPDFSTFYEDSLSVFQPSPDPDVQEISRIFAFDGNVLTEYLNPVIKVVYAYSGEVTVSTGPPVFVALADTFISVAISRDGGLTFPSGYVIDSYASTSPVLNQTFNVLKTTSSHPLTETVDLSLFQIKMILHANAGAADPNSALAIGDVKIYAIYLDSV